MQYQVLIYSPKTSKRLEYVLNWIFNEQLHLTYLLTSDIDYFTKEKCVKINYSLSRVSENELHILPKELLFEQGIDEQTLIYYHRWKHSDIIFYNQPGKEIPFDLFAAVFFMISRYEEYYTHQTDKYGRYQAKNSTAKKFSFLQSPVVDIWVKKLAELLQKKYQLNISHKEFKYIPTYDVDMVWAFRNKSLTEKIGGTVKDILKFNFEKITQRINVNNAERNDPYYSFDYLNELHQQFQLKPLFFILTLKKKGKFDRNTPITHPEMQKLVKELAKQYTLGIHPSYQSHQGKEILKNEIEILHNTAQQTITKSRQHFIKLTLPETYRCLISLGVNEDYSMGYASDNGFRAGTSNSFLWFDILNDETTELRIFPFAFMEATSIFYQKQSEEAALKEWERLVHSVKQVGGIFISIFHNYTLGTSNEYKGWSETYKQMLFIIKD